MLRRHVEWTLKQLSKSETVLRLNVKTGVIREGSFWLYMFQNMELGLVYYTMYSAHDSSSRKELLL